MVFPSNIFLLFFPPLSLAVHYLTPDRGRLRDYAVPIRHVCHARYRANAPQGFTPWY